MVEEEGSPVTASNYLYKLQEEHLLVLTYTAQVSPTSLPSLLSVLEFVWHSFHEPSPTARVV